MQFILPECMFFYDEHVFIFLIQSHFDVFFLEV